MIQRCESRRISEKVFRAVVCNGAFRAFPQTIDTDTLRKLIQSTDGESVEF